MDHVWYVIHNHIQQFTTYCYRYGAASGLGVGVGGGGWVVWSHPHPPANLKLGSTIPWLSLMCIFWEYLKAWTHAATLQTKLDANGYLLQVSARAGQAEVSLCIAMLQVSSLENPRFSSWSAESFPNLKPIQQ